MTHTSRTSLVLKIAAFVMVALFVIVLRPFSMHIFPYHYEEGKMWIYKTLTAEFDFPVYKSDERLAAEREKALQDYAPCFQTVGTASSMIIISAEDMEKVKQGGYDHIAVVNRRHVSTDIPVEKVYTPKTAYLVEKREMTPTLVYDSLTSERVYRNILESVSPTEGAVMAGETIIEHGELISNEDFLVLASLERAYRDRGLDRERLLYIQCAYAILIALVILLLAGYLFIFRKPLWEELRAILFFCLLIGMVAGAALLILRFASPELVYIVPFVWIPILVRVFYDSRTAFVIHLTTVMLVSFSVPNPYIFLILQLSAGMVAVDLLKDITRRSQLAIAAFYVTLVYCVVYTLTLLLVSGDFSQVNGWMYCYFLINGILLVVVYSLIFLFERLFRLVSSITLVELSNINSDLMQDFARVAPGTFQHSLQVSSLASDAAKCIGAKALLVRAGALYHDIGKMVHPAWYTENQAEGNNPLLQMSNREAAQAVISHIVDGETIARKHSLPEIIVTFIRSHHGTSLVRYFYNSEINRLRKSALPENLITPSDYRYPGPKPSTKEAAILMMADAIEARSRSMDNYSEQSISDMVDEMIGLQIQDGQLAETLLSFHDLERVKQSFKERLLAIHHHRIQYPSIGGK